MLIVDGNTRVLQALGGLVSATEGLAVCGLAASAQEALAADIEHDPDLVLVDVVLPTLGEGLSLIRGLSRRQHPVVALSVSGLARDVSLAAGAAAFIEKDTSPESLMATLRGLSHVPK
ncbi:MAG: response regulator [Solirubrobacterales bacterium]|nr:response regulator [Solirubrobacterales bacterium]